MAKKASGVAIPSTPYTLASGREVTFTMPDLFALASGRLDVPNEAQAELFRLLYDGGFDATPAQQLLSDQRYMRSLFHTAQLIISPRVRLDDDDADGVIDRRELALPDLLAAYSFLRYGPSKALPAAEAGDAGAGADAGETGDAVPPGAE